MGFGQTDVNYSSYIGEFPKGAHKIIQFENNEITSIEEFDNEGNLIFQYEDRHNDLLDSSNVNSYSFYHFHNTKNQEFSKKYNYQSDSQSLFQYMSFDTINITNSYCSTIEPKEIDSLLYDNSSVNELNYQILKENLIFSLVDFLYQQEFYIKNDLLSMRLRFNKNGDTINIENFKYYKEGKLHFKTIKYFNGSFRKIELEKLSDREALR